MSIDRYDPIRVLGEGSFGKVMYQQQERERVTIVIVNDL